MIDRARLKEELDDMPEDALEQIAAFIRFQKFAKGLWEDDTAYLSSIPGMVDNIVAGKDTPLSDCFDTLE
jgi:hypothetical protein